MRTVVILCVIKLVLSFRAKQKNLRGAANDAIELSTFCTSLLIQQQVLIRIKYREITAIHLVA